MLQWYCICVFIFYLRQTRTAYVLLRFCFSKNDPKYRLEVMGGNNRNYRSAVMCLFSKTTRRYRLQVIGEINRISGSDQLISNQLKGLFLNRLLIQTVRPLQRCSKIDNAFRVKLNGYVRVYVNILGWFTYYLEKKLLRYCV